MLTGLGKMIKNDSREELVFLAKIGEQAERYEEMVNSMRRLVELEVELTVEEHNLLSVAYKNVVGMRRAAWRILSSIEQKESSRGADLWKLSLISDYRKRTEEEIKSICYEIISLIDNTLLRVTQDPKTRAFFLKMKFDYYRYLAEIAPQKERAQFAQLAIQATQQSSDLINLHLRPTDPFRLANSLRIATFFYDTLNSPARACELAKQAFDDAIAELDEIDEESYKESTLYMQLLRDQLTLWTQDQGDADVIGGPEKG